MNKKLGNFHLIFLNLKQNAKISEKIANFLKPQNWKEEYIFKKNPNA